MPAIVVLVKNVPDTWSTKSLTADFTLDREADYGDRKSVV